MRIYYLLLLMLFFTPLRRSNSPETKQSFRYGINNEKGGKGEVKAKNVSYNIILSVIITIVESF